MQAVLQIHDRQQSIEQVGTVVASHDEGVGAVLGVEFAGQRFQQILQGDQTFKVTIFIHHKRHLGIGVAEVIQQFHAGERLQNKMRRLGQGRQIHLLAFDGLGEQFLGVDHTEDVVHLAVADGKAGVRCRHQAFVVDVQRLGDIEVDDVFARYHQ